MKRADGLFKRHLRGCKNRERLTRCRCPWRARYRQREINLAKWTGKPLDPRNEPKALAAYRRFEQAIEDQTFDRAGERPAAKGGGQTLAEYLLDWRTDHCEERKLSMDSLGPMLDVLSRGQLGGYTLAALAEADDAIEAWLNTTGKLRKWKPGTWNDYHALLKQVCKRAVSRRRMPRNPLDAIEKRAGVASHRGELRHFRLDEPIEAALLEACDSLNRTQAPNRNKLTQEDADAIRARVAAGEQQKALAEAFKVSRAVVCAVVKGTIWNPARRRTTTTGREMRRRVIAAFDTGARAGELLAIQNRHIDWAHPVRQTSADGKRTYNGYVINLPPELTKGGKRTGEVQTLYAMTERLARVLEERRFLGPKAYVFGTEAGTQQSGFRRAWCSLFKAAGLDYGRDAGLVWHTARHEYVSRVVENEKDVTVAQDLARHARLDTTQRYIHTRRHRLVSAAAGLNR